MPLLRRHRIGLVHIVASQIFALLFGAFVEHADAQPRPLDLGTLGGTVSSAIALNDAGQIVGYSYTPTDATYHAFSWTRKDGMIDLGTLGGDNSMAMAVNSIGQVVGWAAAPGGSHAFVWSAADGMIDLGTLPGDGDASANSINADGQVAGHSYAPDGSLRAFLWTRSGGMHALPVLDGAVSAFALRINDRGQIVGNTYLDDGDLENQPTLFHAFSWTHARGLIDLGTLGGDFSFAHAVNGSGQIVGLSGTVDGESHAFSWTETGGMIDLGTLGGTESYALAVNAGGQVVGASTVTEGFANSRAFSWTAAGGMIDFDAAGAFSIATGVNASGQVVGYRQSSLGGLNAFSWTAARGMMDLATLGGRSASGNAVNASGQVMGGSYLPSSELHAALWSFEAATVHPAADTYVRAGSFASTNFGSASTLGAKKGVSDDNTRRSYLKFDIGGVADVGRATLRLYGHLETAASHHVITTAYAVSDSAWPENKVTWNSRPALGAVLGSFAIEGMTPQWVEVDITSFVRAEKSAGRNLISVALRNVPHTSAASLFSSREARQGVPELIIEPSSGTPR